MPGEPALHLRVLRSGPPRPAAASPTDLWTPSGHPHGHPHGHHPSSAPRRPHGGAAHPPWCPNTPQRQQPHLCVAPDGRGQGGGGAQRPLPGAVVAPGRPPNGRCHPFSRPQPRTGWRRGALPEEGLLGRGVQPPTPSVGLTESRGAGGRGPRSCGHPPPATPIGWEGRGGTPVHPAAPTTPGTSAQTWGPPRAPRPEVRALRGPEGRGVAPGSGGQCGTLGIGDTVGCASHGGCGVPHRGVRGGGCPQMGAGGGLPRSTQV